MWRKKLTRKHWILCFTLPSILALDQLTKAVVKYAIPLYRSISVIPGFFSITHVKNTGAAFGLFAGSIHAVRTLFFVAITVGALVLIFFIFRKIRGDRALLPLSLAMIMAGALGNLVDRIRWGYVVDFLDFYWRTYHWPAFNISDSAITVGVLLLFVDNLFLHRKDHESKDISQGG